MSEALPPREWRFYVEDMVTFCDKVLIYTTGLDRASFTADAMRYDATLRNLELIGEAATHVPADVRAMTGDVPWRMVIAVRNRPATSASTMTRSGASSATTSSRYVRV